LRKDRPADLEFHCGSGPRDHGKRWRLFFEQEHAPRSLLDTAHCIALQQLRRYSGDARATVIEDKDALDASPCERFSHNLPESLNVLFKALIKLSRLGHGRLDDSDSPVTECLDHGTTV